MKKIFTLLTFGIGFLVGSRAGRGPYEKFLGWMRKLRHTKVVATPIESAADRASNLVRARGQAITDHMADATYRRIAGNPTFEAQVVDVYDDRA